MGEHHGSWGVTCGTSCMIPCFFLLGGPVSRGASTANMQLPTSRHLHSAPVGSFA